MCQLWEQQINEKGGLSFSSENLVMQECVLARGIGRVLHIDLFNVPVSSVFSIKSELCRLFG